MVHKFHLGKVDYVVVLLGADFQRGQQRKMSLKWILIKVTHTLHQCLKFRLYVPFSYFVKSNEHLILRVLCQLSFVLLLLVLALFFPNPFFIVKKIARV